MKKALLYIFLSTAMMVWSCGEDENMEPIGNWELSSPVPGSPSSSAGVVLNHAQPTAPVTFEWQAATTSNKFLVSYKVYVVPAESNDVENPILELTPAASGRDRTVSVTAQQLDYALWTRCYPAGAAANLKWVVVAKAIEKTSSASSPFQATRFTTDYKPSALFITGSATEAGSDVTKASPMRARKNADNVGTGVFDVYTTLTEGASYVFRDQASATSKTFGGSNGNLSGCGSAITAPATGQYRVTVDLNTNKYELWKVEKWSVVGDAFEGGWGGDTPLAYKGNGVWEAKVDFINADKNWIFRANGDWGYIIKPVKNTVSPNGLTGKVIMENEAGAAGVEVQDARIADSGIHTITLDLRANAYTFTIVPEPVAPGANIAMIGKSNSPNADQVSGNFDFGTYDAPAQLFLVSNGASVGELTKNGNTFTSTYLALEKSKQYILNSAADGSGTTYNNIGDGKIGVDHDQAYMITVNFDTKKVAWKHYNLKVFHWDNDGGWDQRNEYPMTYVHPYKFEANGINLKAGFDVKFNSPWEVQFGTNATALTGTMTNGGDNFKGINSNGTYNASIVVNDTFTEAQYSFVKQ